MTQNELDALTAQQTLTNRANRAAQLNQNAVYQGQLGNPYGPGMQLATNTLSSPWMGSQQAQARSILEENEKQMIRAQEREACFQLVMDMAEELNCPNLLHGVALAIKARGSR